MGISIEEAKAMLKSYLHGSTGYTGSLRDAIDTVLPIVEKYQQIQAIMHKEYASDQADVCLVQRLVEIREVLEDRDGEFDDSMSDWQGEDRWNQTS